MNRGRTFRITLSPEHSRELRAAAQQRNVPPGVFLRVVVELMLRDRLLDAVIDDFQFVGGGMTTTRCTADEGGAVVTQESDGPAPEPRHAI